MTKVHQAAIRHFGAELRDFREREQSRFSAELSASEEYCEDLGYCERCLANGCSRSEAGQCAEFASPTSHCRLECRKSCPQPKRFLFTKLVFEHPLHEAATSLRRHYKPNERLPLVADRLFRKLLVLTGQLSINLGVNQALITSSADLTFENFLQTVSELEDWCRKELGEDSTAAPPQGGVKLPAVPLEELHLYREFKEIWDECQKRGIEISESQLRRYLELTASEIRQGRPTSVSGKAWKQRRLVHIDDWRKNFPDFKSWFSRGIRFD